MLSPALALAALLVVTAPGVAAQAGTPQRPPTPESSAQRSGNQARFSSSFEAGQPAPDWHNTPEKGPDGKPRTGGLAAGMATTPGNGPANSPTAKEKAGFTGKHALRYSGTHRAAGRGYAYHKVFDTHLPVTANSRLSYRIFPEMPADDRSYAATHASVDLAFTDGSYLSQLRATDQHGERLSPQGQGRSRTLQVNQWNQREARIGRVAAGKTVARILVAYDAPTRPQTPSTGPGRKSTKGGKSGGSSQSGSGASVESGGSSGSSFRGWVDDISLAPAAPPRRRAHLSDYADTTRGTNSSGDFSRGNNLPATAVPHGFNFWSPVTNAGATDWIYDYARKNNRANRPALQAFSVSHQPSPWMGDRQTFQVMPSLDGGTPRADRKARAMPFRHSRETARPHYYGVTFENGLRAEMTPTDHAAVLRFTFPKSAPRSARSLVFDNVNNKGGLRLDPKRGTVTGYSDVKSKQSTGATRMYVYGKLDSPAAGGGKLTGGGGKDVTGYLRAAPGGGRTVTLRIATSLLSTRQARANLRQEAPDTASFGRVRHRAQQGWERVMRRIEVAGASEDQLTTLYSSLYRLYLYPNSGSEQAGSRRRYASPFSPPRKPSTPTKTGAKVTDGQVYVNNGFWDTYRTTWPAYSLFTPRRAGRLADGFVQHYKDGGWTSRWSSPGYADLMTGTSADVALADAYGKGVHFDSKAAYEAAVKNATVAPAKKGVGRKGMATAPFLGYTGTGTEEGLSWTLEGCINDFGLARMGATLYQRTKNPRYKAESDYFSSRARNYVHLFDKRIGFFQGRDGNGSWRLSPSAYDPRVWGHDYTESNGWNFAFTAPQDTAGLAALYGGRTGLARKLDEYFTTPETGEKRFSGSYDEVIHEMTEARDVRMGMYAHSNQPAHHVSYLYDAAGQPWKTQAKVREVLRRLYLGSEIGQGYAGDEDNGEMSAWYLFSSLGFYPLVMGSPEYAVGSPQFTRATVRMDNGRKLVVKAPRNSRRNVYVQGLKVNGKPWHSTRLPHRLLARGGTLEFAMGPKPSRWGTGRKAQPSSLTPEGSKPAPLRDLTRGGGALSDNTSKTTADVGKPVLRVPGGSRVTSYTLTSGNRQQAPHGWVLQGSQDGKRWRDVDRRTGERFRWNRQTRVFALPKTGHYRQYRLVPAAGGSRAGDNSSPSLAEVELLGR